MPLFSGKFILKRRLKMNQILEEIKEDNPEALLADGFDDAILGIGRRCGQPSLVVYSTPKCIKILMEDMDCSEEEAIEFFEFNVVGAWVGEHTPIFVDTY
jgi:hypothetical protein